MLLERSPAPLPTVVERMGGVQAQYAPSIYFGLLARTRELDRAQVTRALERRSLVQGTLLRATIHVVPRAQWWSYALTGREFQRHQALRMPGSPTEPDMQQASAQLHDALAGGGTLRRTEIEDLIGKPATRAVGLWLSLVRVPPSGTWERRRADLFGLAQEWVGPCASDPQAALVDSVRSYLTGFGPATRHEIADWTGVGRVGAIDAVLDQFELRRFRADDGAELLDLPRLALPDADTPAPPRLLPWWDATLLVHARRTQILPEEHRKKIFHQRAPQSFPTFLVDGQVAGKWRLEAGRVKLEPFGRLTRTVRTDLTHEAERLEAFAESTI